MKLKSKKIIYELEDGVTYESLSIKDGTATGYLKRILKETNRSSVIDAFSPSFKLAMVWELVAKPTRFYLTQMTKHPDGFNHYFTNKDEAIKTAEDYLKGES